MTAARRLAFVLVALLLWMAPALAYDEALIGEAERAAEALRVDLAAVEKELQNPAITDPQLTELRGALEDMRGKAQAAAAKLAGPVQEVNQQIALIGPAPKDAGPEPPAVTEQREALNDQLNRLLGAKSQLDLVAVNAEQLASRASTLQRTMFLTRIFEAGRSVLNPSLWRDTAAGAELLAGRLSVLLSTWWAQVQQTGTPATLLLLPAFLALSFGTLWLARLWLRRKFPAHAMAERSPDDLARLWRVVSGVAATFAVLVAVTLPFSLTLQAGGLMTPRLALLYDALLGVLFVTATCTSLARRLAAPGRPAWRLTDLDDAAASRLPLLAGLTAFVSIATLMLGEIADALYLPVAYTIGQSALSAMAMLVLLSLTLLQVGWQREVPGRAPARPTYFTWVRSLVPLFWLLIGTGVVALLLGYVALASFIAQQLFQTVLLVIVLFLLHYLSDAAVSAAIDPQNALGRILRRATHLGERSIQRLGLLVRTVVDLFLVVAGLPLLFLIWTVTWIDFRGLANRVLLDFRVGEVTLSPWSILVALMFLAGGVVLTKLLVRWLDRRILVESRWDKGVQDSLRKGVSYAGYIIAAVFAFRAAGLDFSNIALIVGALGVGIGFGLQSIVNNFVSGLILLVERPVRVGDWVVLSSGEGLIKRINVRATEIETFDSCAIIVPNSTLITEAVKNWTHGDSMGRFTVAVCVSYDSNAETVRDILMEAARAHPKVLTYPEPQVQLMRFGLFGLEFEAKAFVADVFEGVIVASDLRFAILGAFAEKGITIAKPPALWQPERP